ncbi:hypothetical protein [Rhodopila sp.]|uniref:hypothetical protein n=1 Tax=Rhodopila sp. TaxID=2480087 RepID=UPI003D141C83
MSDNSSTRHCIKAVVSSNAKVVRVIFPACFIGKYIDSVAYRTGRHKINFDDAYDGEMIGRFVDKDGVERGKIDFEAHALGLEGLVPGKVNTWWAWKRDRDLLLGTLFTDLCSPEAKQGEVGPAVAFINQWISEQKGTVRIENGLLVARA